MRRGWLLAVCLLAFAGNARAQVSQVTDYGFKGFEGNEDSTGSIVNDPAKNRLTTPITETGGGGGAVSFNANLLGHVALGGGQREMGMIRVEQAEDVRGQVSNLKSEMNFMLNDGSGSGDDAMTKPLAFTAHAITRMDAAWAASFAAHLAPFLGGGGSSRIVSPNGRFWFQPTQDDGNFVLYDANDPTHPIAVFDLWSLLARLDRVDAELRSLEAKH